MRFSLTPETTLPADGAAGTLVGRVWRPDVEGPAIVVLKGETLVDISQAFPTLRDLCESPDPAQAATAASGKPLGLLADILRNTPADDRDPRKAWLLAPLDLQAIKAAGVTFVVSLLERVIEERAERRRPLLRRRPGPLLRPHALPVRLVERHPAPPETGPPRGSGALRAGTGYRVGAMVSAALAAGGGIAHGRL